MSTPEEAAYVPQEAQKHGPDLPLSGVTVEVPYRTPDYLSPPSVTVSSASDLKQELDTHLTVNPVRVEDALHSGYVMAVGGDGSRVSFCPERVILPHTEKQLGYAQEALRLSRQIAENTRAMVVANKSGPLWDSLPSIGQGGQGVKERLAAVALKAKIALAEAELNNMTNLAEGEGALVLPRKQAAEVARRVDVVTARGQTVTDKVFATIVSRVQKEYAPPVRKLAKPLSSPRTRPTSSRPTLPLSDTVSNVFGLIHPDTPGYRTIAHKSFPNFRLASYAATAIVIPMIMVDCGGGRVTFSTSGSEIAQRTDLGYERTVAHNIAVGAELSAWKYPDMQALLTGLASYNKSHDIPLTNKAEVVTMKGPEGFVSQFAFTEDPKSPIEASNGVLPVTIARIGSDGHVTTAPGVYLEETSRDGVTTSQVGLVKKTATGWKLDESKIVWSMSVDGKGNIVMSFADTKRTSPYYVELIGTVPIDPNPPKQNQPPDPFEPAARSMGSLLTMIISKSEPTTQAPTATPKVETPTPQPPTPKPTDMQPTQAKEPTKAVEKIANVPPEYWGTVFDGGEWYTEGATDASRIPAQELWRFKQVQDSLIKDWTIKPEVQYGIYPHLAGPVDERLGIEYLAGINMGCYKSAVRDTGISRKEWVIGIPFASADGTKGMNYIIQTLSDGMRYTTGPFPGGVMDDRTAATDKPLPNNRSAEETCQFLERNRGHRLVVSIATKRNLDPGYGEFMQKFISAVKGQRIVPPSITLRKSNDGKRTIQSKIDSIMSGQGFYTDGFK